MWAITSEAKSQVYATHDYDSESGVYYSRARSYDPVTGAFLQKDPSGIVSGNNGYLYVNDNPVNSIDQDGKFAQIIWGAMRWTPEFRPGVNG